MLYVHPMQIKSRTVLDFKTELDFRERISKTHNDSRSQNKGIISTTIDR